MEILLFTFDGALEGDIVAWDVTLLTGHQVFGNPPVRITEIGRK
jgi:hypothetical protein